MFCSKLATLFHCLGKLRAIVGQDSQVIDSMLKLGLFLFLLFCQASSVELKNTWISEIRKVLTGQLEACRGRTHKARSGNVAFLL